MKSGHLQPAKADGLSARFAAAAYISFSALLASALFFLGRIWWCKCGNLSISSWNVLSEHNSQHLIDWYSPSHFLHGILFFALLGILPFSLQLRFVLALLIECGWEFLENTKYMIDRYRAVTASYGYSGDSIANSLSDACMCALGFYAASRLRPRTLLAIVLIAEGTATLLIRDGLILNILMLTWPIEGIRQWQMAPR